MKARTKDGRPQRSTTLRGLAAIIMPLAVMGCASGAGPSSAGQPSGQQPATRLGVVDLQRVLVETDAGKKARESLNTFMKNRQAVVELEEKDLKRMEEDLIKQASVLSATAKKEREDVLRRRVMEFQQKATDLNREVQEKQKEVLEAFREKAERVVTKVAQQLGLTMVMEKGRGGPTVYSEASLDISGKVIEEFNKETGKL